MFSICYYTLKYYHPTNLINEINVEVLKGLFTELLGWKYTNYVLKIIINPSLSIAEKILRNKLLLMLYVQLKC